MLAIASSRGRLRVDVHDTSRSLPAVAEVPADAETGRGLLLVETLSDEWGFYRTPAGKAVYFTLAFEPDKADKADNTVTPPSEHRSRRAAVAVPAARLAPP